MFDPGVAYPAYLRARARELRTKNRLSLNEIAERLALPKTTVYYWILDLPLGRPRRESPHPGNRDMQAKYRRLREAAYERGWAEYNELILVPTFRDFVVLYIAEGYKRCRNAVSIANSDARVMALAASWLRRLSMRRMNYAVQYHVDQNLDEIRTFWGEILDADPSFIRLQRKSNSNQLKFRTWRCKYGVLTIRVNDTLLRARLQAWIDRIREEWALDSATASGA
jgi:transcriptional regulator with XRE-family HTH domain